MPKGLDAAVADHLFSALSRRFRYQSEHFSEAFRGVVDERRTNETTLPMYPVTKQMEISSFCLDYELVR
jgi:hypothetical protein